MPTDQSDGDLLAAAGTWADAGHGVAIGTVIRTWGSAPRPVGSQIIVRDDGKFVGSVSGGCIEGAVITEARAAIADGRTRHLSYGVSNETAWDVGLACGGTIEILVAPRHMKRSHLTLIRQRVAAGEATVLVTRLSDGETILMTGADTDVGPLADAARTAISSGESKTITTGSDTWFLHVFLPAPRLFIIGAVHIAVPLCQMAAMAGYGVTIIDPRAAFATPERFPDVTLDVRWPNVVFCDLHLDRSCALVALTHDPKLDDPALCSALASPCFYIGALGSGKTHAGRILRLTAKGIAAADLARIRGPIGLDIGARTPAEIAIAIMAEMTLSLRKGTAP